MSDNGGTNWSDTLLDLEERRERARAMGGADRLERHRRGGRLDARGRIDALFDEGTFHELGTLAGGEVPADGLVAGWGLVEGRPVFAGAEDFTTLAGTIGVGSHSKRHRLAELALQERCPLVMLLEGAGFRPGDQSHGRMPTDLIAQAKCSGYVPIAVGVMGAAAGHSALIAPVADFTVMTPDASIFTAGPPVVREATGEDVHKLDLGGPKIAIPSGLIRNLATDDRDLLDQIRRYLSFFPSSSWSYPEPDESADDGHREVPELLDLIPRNGRAVYDMRRVLEVVVDDGDFFEVQPRYGEPIICALARLGGDPVAIVANQPSVIAGAIDVPAADKAAHFITVADSFHLPIVFLADTPGMLPGTRSEIAGVLRAGGRMFAAQTLASTIKLNVTFRKGYGFGSMVMSMIPYDGQTGTFAFPGMTHGAMGADASGRASKADDELQARLRDIELQASYTSASRLGFDELIDPRDTRNVLIDHLRLALHRRQAPAAPVSRVGITP